MVQFPPSDLLKAPSTGQSLAQLHVESEELRKPQGPGLLPRKGERLG